MVFVVVQWLAWFVVPFFFPDYLLYGMLVAAVCALAIVLWWLIFSRAPWYERIGALVLIILAVIATKRIVHVSIATGSMGFLLFVIAIPVMSLALVAAALISRRLSATPRRAVIAAAILFACGVFTLLRTAGATGEFKNDFHWRWSKTPEERLLAQGDDETATSPGVPVPAGAGTGADWPGFRGFNREGAVRGVQINTDWSTSPPVELWRRPIDLKDGKRKWKGARYGYGQLVLLPDQDVLLVLSEKGELALVKATPDQFTEVARFPAIEGKTWNHPVLAGDVLLVRNGHEMAAFRLSPANR